MKPLHVAFSTEKSPSIKHLTFKMFQFSAKRDSKKLAHAVCHLGFFFKYFICKNDKISENSKNIQ